MESRALIEYPYSLGQEKQQIEMQVIAINSYTSLKDLLPHALAWNGGCRCRREIPIKEPLLQQAAWAYLQPMGIKSDKLGDQWWQRLQDKWCRMLGCFNDVVVVVLHCWFSSHMEMARPELTWQTHHDRSTRST